MTFVSPFAYAQARLQARFGQRPNAAVWERLHALGELPAWLEQARATALEEWVAAISATTPAHEIERLLRARLRDTIEEVARWVPSGWRAAVSWAGVVSGLPALAHLLRGETAYAWMREEPLLRAVADVEPGLRARVLAQGPWAALAAPHPAAATLFEVWLAEWRRRHPGRSDRPAFDELTALLQMHRTAFLRLPTGPGDDARRALEARLERLFHRAFLSPVAVFAWLLLAALEFERVRCELLTRALFPAPETA